MSLFRLLPLAFVLGLFLASTSAVSAEEAVFDNCKVVKAEDGRLRVIGPGGGENSAAVAPDAKITLDGKSVKLGDLKEGTRVKMTVRKEAGAEPVILKIEGTTK